MIFIDYSIPCSHLRLRVTAPTTQTALKAYLANLKGDGTHEKSYLVSTRPGEKGIEKMLLKVGFKLIHEGPRSHGDLDKKETVKLWSITI